MQIKNLRYNAVAGVYKASVDIERFGRVFRYPCEVPGPRDMDHSILADHLRNRAMQMSDTVI